MGLFPPTVISAGLARGWAESRQSPGLRSRPGYDSRAVSRADRHDQGRWGLGGTTRDPRHHGLFFLGSGYSTHYGTPLCKTNSLRAPTRSLLNKRLLEAPEA